MELTKTQSIPQRLKDYLNTVGLSRTDLAKLLPIKRIPHTVIQWILKDSMPSDLANRDFIEELVTRQPATVNEIFLLSNEICKKHGIRIKTIKPIKI